MTQGNDLADDLTPLAAGTAPRIMGRNEVPEAPVSPDEDAIRAPTGSKHDLSAMSGSDRGGGRRRPQPGGIAANLGLLNGDWLPNL